MHALDRPLVSGLMALEQHFVTAEELIEAFRVWRLQPEGSLGQILASRGKLSEERIQSLEKLYNSSVLQEQSSLADSTNGATSTGRAGATSVDERVHPTAAMKASERHVVVSVRSEQADVGDRF